MLLAIDVADSRPFNLERSERPEKIAEVCLRNGYCVKFILMTDFLYNATHLLCVVLQDACKNLDNVYNSSANAMRLWILHQLQSENQKMLIF